MAAPTNGSSTDESNLHVIWTALTTTAETGGSAITSYDVQFDKGTNQGTWYEVVGLSSAFTGTTTTYSTAISSGTRYYFKVRA